MFQKTYLSPNPATGQKGSKFTTHDANSIVGELGNIVTGLGGTLDATKNNQVITSLTSHFAPINSPILTGTPQTTVPPAGDNSSRIPTTSWVLSTVTAGTHGVYVSQGGGTNMGANTIKLGTQSGDVNDFLIQSDSNASLGIVLQQADAQTLGIKRIGWNKAGVGCWIQDTSGTGRFLVDADQLTTKLAGYLPLTGGTVTGQTTIEDIVFTNDSSLSNARIIHSDSDTYNHSISLMTDIYASSSGSSFVTSSLTNTMCLNAWGGGFMFRDSRGSGDAATRLMFVNSSSTTIYKPLTVEGVATIESLNSDGGHVTTDGVGNLTISGGLTANSVRLAGTPQTQGANIFWNAAGSGTTDFVNGRGLGSGGFTWLDGTTAMTENWSTINKDNYKVMTLDGSGNLQTKGNITANGFLYSPNYVTAPTYHVDNNSNISEIYFNNNTKSRWAIGKDNSSESGSNDGGNFVFARFADDGSYLDIPLSILRSSGAVHINKSLLVPTVATSDNSLNAASTSYVKNNLANYPANGTWASFTGANFANGVSGASIYADTNKRDLVFHTTNGTTDHYMVLDEAGVLTTPGNLVVNGGQWVGGELYTNTIGNNGSGTVTMNSNVNVVATLSQGGNPVATAAWTSDNYIATATATSGSNDLKIKYIGWSQAIGNKAYLTHYDRDGSSSGALVICTEDRFYSGLIADNGAYTDIRYFVIDGIMTLTFKFSGKNTAGATANDEVIFPKAFGSGCVPTLNLTINREPNTNGAGVSRFPSIAGTAQSGGAVTNTNFWFQPVYNTNGSNTSGEAYILHVTATGTI